ncbi:hypothetical protein DAPPUDRAFT_266550 [Daphnia pulex]|uniref:Uncharacterized protein n=1 Tax=Daphnia pulex TaxID=6669 RepID=E9HV68_DAPPU|nr:hypothetical protein DAPPUDRAFT_266550 [Daphnia pulex]|eukprot:EFX64362.1 hypothetical protein DAPPUDRAFT_266550 [Daphnia pulex]
MRGPRCLNFALFLLISRLLIKNRLPIRRQLLTRLLNRLLGGNRFLYIFLSLMSAAAAAFLTEFFTALDLLLVLVQYIGLWSSLCKVIPSERMDLYIMVAAILELTHNVE